MVNQTKESVEKLAESYFEGQSVLDEFEEVMDQVDETPVKRLLEESKSGFEANLPKSSFLNLWSAGIEQLKNLMMIYDYSQLQDAKNIPSNTYSKKSLDEVSDYELLEAAEDLGLLTSNELPVLQSLYNIRCKCAHGDEIEISEELLVFTLNKIREDIFEKWDVAGTNPKMLVNLTESGNIPEKRFEAVEGFEREDQYQLMGRLFEKRENLPPLRMRKRDRFLTGKKYTLTHRKRRDHVIKAIDLIWDDLEPQVRRTFGDKALKKKHRSNIYFQFLIAHHLSDIESERANEVLSDYLDQKSSGDYEDQNDVAITLERADNLEFANEDNSISIWRFCCQKFANQKEETKKIYRKILELLDENSREYIVEEIVNSMEEREGEWVEQMIEDEDYDKLIAITQWEYFDWYRESFEVQEKEKLADYLSDSIFSDIPSIENFVNEFEE